MDKEIFKLSKQANKRRLVEYLNEQTEDEINHLVRYKLDDYHAANDVDTTLLLRAIMLGSPVEYGQQCLQRRFTVIACVIQWLSTEDKEKPEKTKQASAIVNLILPEIELLSTPMLQTAGKMITDIIHECSTIQLRLLDILIKIWNVLVAAGEYNELSDIFDSLFEAKWHPQLIVGIASALNDMELSNSQLETALKHMTKKISNIEIEEVPPFIWQLLLISRKGHKRLVLEGIFNYFNHCSEIDTSRVEGTVMLHLSFALKQDQDLGNELFKLVKNKKSGSLELFDVACLLTAARIHRLQDIIFDFFKVSIITIYKDNEKLQKRCSWISEYFPLEANKYSQVLLDITDKSATAGWDQVIQTLCQLAMILIDTAANAGNPFINNQNTIKLRSNGLEEDSPMEKVAQLGINILLRLFKYHDVVRSEILEQMTSRIVSRANSAIDFLKLLARIIQGYPDIAEKYLNNIKDTLDILSFLPLPTAEHLLKAIRPLLTTNEQFQDGLILVLRKSLFAKDFDGREMAVKGFLNLLHEQLIEIGQDKDIGQQFLAVQGVAYEILGLLRRCFSQQYEIRACTYKGLGSLSLEHTNFAGDIFESLYTQFMKSYEKDENIINPIRVENCIENANNGGYPTLLEPVHILIANLVKALEATSTASISSFTADTIAQFKNNMQSFIDRLSKANLEDFELDKSANFDMATHIGLRNNQHANFLLGVYEIAMEYVFSINGITRESCENILNLFKKRKVLIGVLKDASTKEKSRKNASITSQPCISLRFVSKIFQAVFSLDSTSEGMIESTRDLRSDIDFAHFIITRACDSLRSAIDDPYCQQDDEHVTSSIEICKTCMSILAREDSDSIFANQQSSAKKTQSVLGSIATSILTIMEMVSRVWPEKLLEFLKYLVANSAPENSTKSKNRVIIEIVMQLKEVILKYLSGRTPIYKETSNVMRIITFLCDNLEKNDDDFIVQSRFVVSWLNSLAQERPIEEVSLVKDVITLLIQLCAMMGEFDTIQNICEDIHQFTGDLDILQEESQREQQQPIKYRIVNYKTFAVITSKIFEFLDTSFDDLTWCIGRLKICASLRSFDNVAKEFESTLCQRLISVMSILSELVKSVLTDVHAESLFKTLAKAYKTLHTLVKYKLNFAQDVSPCFVNVISKCGSEITEKMYKFLTVYGQSQSQDSSAIDRSKKKSRKKEVDVKRKAKIQRESKMIPNLIFAVEQFERHLIQLSRKSRVDFMQYMKRSTSRDFKIQLDRVMQQESSDEEEDIKNKRPNFDDDNSTGESSKRARLA
ncbi:MAG: FANCI solenoid 4-domain-containing protein [Benjaminiella poitrasii]|nr:MAG: FANCI solenoid 4-domain-containing protein [Benjaminiella poitrasii]